MKTFGRFILSLIFSSMMINSCFADSVMIDPGHGGVDSGAISYDNSLQEKDLNLETAKATIAELKKHGVTVYTTRTGDTYVSLNDRSKMANAIKDLDLFVSIHHNASSNTSVNRSEVIYSVKEAESQKLAECIGAKLHDMDNIDVKIYTRYNSRGSDYYGVLRNTNAKSVIVEISFITSKEGVALVDTPEERAKNGVLVAQGIMDYLGIDYSQEKQKEKVSLKAPDKKEVNNGIAIINRVLQKKRTNNSVLERLLRIVQS